MTTFPQTEAEHVEQSKNQAPAADLLGSNDTREKKCESSGAQPLHVQTESQCRNGPGPPCKEHNAKLMCKRK